MHRKFRELLEDAKGESQYVIAVVLDIRGFTPFCEKVDSLESATYIKRIYMKIIDEYFSNASFYKPTGDGLLLIIPYNDKSLREVAKRTIQSCFNLLESFSTLLEGDPMINFDTPEGIGIGITRGSACCITSKEKTLDYSGKVLNLASRLMNQARPSGIVFDSSFGEDLLPEELKELFSEDAVYVRGIAEAKPITVYYTKSYTLIPPVHKNPIKDPKWKTEISEVLMKTFRRLKPTYVVELESKPLGKDQIHIEISHPTIDNGEIMKGYTHYWYFDVRSKEISYRIRAGEHSVRFKIKEISEELQLYGVMDDMTLKFKVTYPVL